MTTIGHIASGVLGVAVAAMPAHASLVTVTGPDAIPESATLLLFGIGLIGAARTCRSTRASRMKTGHPVRRVLS